MRRLFRAGAPGVVALLVVGCMGRSGEAFPAPGWERGEPPGLGSARVLVLPPQEVGAAEGADPAPAVEELDRELRYALRAAAPQVDWRDLSGLEETAVEAGRLGADPRELPVGVFGVGEVRRVGDPLFGDLYRLASFIGADLVVLPIRAWWIEGEAGTRAMVLHGALLAPRTGRVLWQGIVSGAFGPSDSPAPAASAAERLAASVLR